MAAALMNLLICRPVVELSPQIKAVVKRFNVRLHIATNEKQLRQLLRDHELDLALIGSGLSPETRGAMVQAIGSMRDDLTIHINGNSTTGMTFAQFMDKTLSSYMPKH